MLSYSTLLEVSNHHMLVCLFFWLGGQVESGKIQPITLIYAKY